MPRRSGSRSWVPGWNAASGTLSSSFSTHDSELTIDLRSCVAYHFGCLPASQKREITNQLKAEHLAIYDTLDDVDTPASLAVPAAPKSAGSSLTPLTASTAASAAPSKSGSPRLGILKRDKYELDPERVFTMRKCPSCKKMGGRRCFVCGVSGKVVTKRELMSSLLCFAPH